MNDRSRWNGPRDDSQGYGSRQSGGWGSGRGGQPQQAQNWSAQQGGWDDSSERNDWSGRTWRGSRDWGDPRPQPSQWQDTSFRDNAGSDWDDGNWGSELRAPSQSGRRGPAWDDPAGLGSRPGTSPRDYGEGYQRDDAFRPGSQSLAAGYGMRDGPNYDLGYASAGASRPSYGRGYGPDYLGQGGQPTNRGLVERIGDTVAGWFGADESSNGRESHRGRGPGDYTRSDERIREDANDRLTEDHWLDARRISVRVEKGEVTLEGSVSDRTSKRRAEDLVDAISGVKHVQNNLRIATAGETTASSTSATTGSRTATSRTS